MTMEEFGASNPFAKRLTVDQGKGNKRQYWSPVMGWSALENARKRTLEKK